MTTRPKSHHYFFYLMAGLIISPLMALGLEGMFATSEIFDFLMRTVLDDVLVNSVFITLLTTIGVLGVGISTAWLSVNYDFWGRSVLQWALFMPLAFPAYILAYVYTDFFDVAGGLAVWLKSFDLNVTLPDLRTVWGASFILTFCLYPYVYLFARNGFLSAAKNQIESASLLGAGKWSQFFDVALPAARPFIIVGLTLVIMEVLADYGTMDYFGLRVFSTVIYDAWAGYGDITAAARLSLLLLAFVLLLVFFEKQQRGRMKFHGNNPQPLSRQTGAIWMSLYSAAPVFIGFIAPMIIMLSMMIDQLDMTMMLRSLPYLFNTLICAFTVASLGIVIAFILTAQKIKTPNTLKEILFSLSGFGYALPGIILGLGLLLLSSVFSHFGVLATGSLIFLIAGYLIRFLNVALQGIEAGYEKMGSSIDEASRLMGQSALDDLWHVKLPLLWPSMLSAGLILAVEVIKELPLTLVLRPFDFDTLAVYTYHLASDERLAQAAFPALLIVIAGCVPVLLLQKLSRHE